MTRILIVDDEPSIRASLRMMLQDNYDVLESADGRNAVETVKKEAVDLVLLDIRLPEIDGLQVLEQIREIDDSLNVIVLTADRTVSTAVGAMKRGAFDYITKPFEVEELESVVVKALENRRLITENKYLRTEVSKVAPDNMIGESPAMKKVFQLVRDVADSDATVMITGESGTGKELVARAVHKMSKRADRLFVPVSCAAIPENLLESELFGHEKGSFTGAFDRHIGKFEVASGGTLFLDEIGFLPFSMQAKLLRAVQEREIERVGGSKPIKIDVRIVAATNVNLEKAVEEGTFRRDLYYRLNVVPVELPSLRERPGDVHRLLSHFLEKFNKTFRRNIKGFTPEAIELLEKYSWPGNVRELQNLVERLIVLTRESTITAQMLPPEISRSPESPTSDDFAGLSFKEATRRFESQFIEAVIQKAGGNKSKAARMLGIHRNTLLQLEKKAKTVQKGTGEGESEAELGPETSKETN